MSRRQRVVSIPQWAALIDLAGDGPSLAVARALVDQRHGPQVVQVRRRRRTDAGVRLRDHERWLRENEWARFLAAEVARERRK